jgi:hypothetical protein
VEEDVYSVFSTVTESTTEGMNLAGPPPGQQGSRVAVGDVSGPFPFSPRGSLRGDDETQDSLIIRQPLSHQEDRPN